MIYSYTLLADLVEKPPRFDSKKAMLKHIELNTKEEDFEYGILVDAGSRSFKFDSKSELVTFLSFDDE